MKEIKITLGSIEAVKEFVSLANRCDFDIDLRSGRYAVDAKSIMGIFSLDLARTLTLVLHSDGEDAENFLDDISGFVKK